jgi:hypothetical protein
MAAKKRTAKTAVAKRAKHVESRQPDPVVEVPGANHPRPEARPDYRPPAAHDAKADR